MAPKYGGTLRLASPAATPVIGWPAGMGATMSGTMAQVCLETLLRQNAEGDLVPWLAESYDVADDLTSITFHIRKGVKFHDGSDLNADVVKWNLENFMSAGGGASAPAAGAGAPPAGATAGAPPADSGAAAGAAPPADAAAGAAPPSDASAGGAPPADASAGGAPPAGAVPGAAAAGVSTWSSVEVIDEYTVKVNLSEWNNYTPAGFADAGTLISMVSKASFDEHGLDWMKANPVGTGPFVFESYTQDAGATFKKNPDYWATDEQGNKLPYLDGVEFKFGGSLQNRQQMVLSDEVDLALSIEPGAGAADLAAKGYNMVVVRDVNNEIYFDTTSQGSPWAKKEVREAAEYAIDREALAKGLGFGFVTALYQIPPSSTTAYNLDFAAARKYDTEKAKQLLAAAGYPDGFETTIVLSPVGVNPDIATAVQGYWSAIGIKAQIEKPDMGKFMTYCYPGTFTKGGVVMMGQPAADPSFIAGFNFMLTMVGANWERTAQFNSLLKAATSSPTMEPGKVRAVTDYLSSEALVLPVMESGSGNCMQKYVMNADGGRGAFNVLSFEKIWLNK